ncbi:hypothetical protein Tco_1085532 [Tanacetum coccineum]
MPIQQETPHTQSPSIQKVLVSVIPKTTNLLPIPEIVTETPVLTVVPSPQVTPIISTMQQIPTPIPTPPITTNAPTITTSTHESDALSAVELRVAKLEKDVSELKTVDHSFESLLFSNPKFPRLAYLEEYDLKSALYQSMHANKSFNRNPTNHRLYHALMEALIEDENAMDKGVADTSASEKESVEEPIAEVVMDDAGNDVAHDDNHPKDTSEPKTRKTLNPYWFKQPPRPPTPDPEWNKC